MVKIIGEFWAQITEGDGNFHMFEFLEREGAQVLVEPIGTWVMYMMYQVKARAAARRSLDAPYKTSAVVRVAEAGGERAEVPQKQWMIGVGERIYARQYQRAVEGLGNIAHELVDQKKMAELANPFYNEFARGGEGHLEVGKNVYYTKNQLCHMVLALKPFGCMPSSQSDGVQSGRGQSLQGDDLPAHRNLRRRRDQRSQPRADGAGRSQGQGAHGIRTGAEVHRQAPGGHKGLRRRAHPELRNVFYPVPHRHGYAGVAANFVLARQRPDERQEEAGKRAGAGAAQAGGSCGLATARSERLQTG